MKKSFFTTLIFLWSAVFLSLQAQDCSAPAAPDVNWSGCNKTNANLSGAMLNYANLSGANLTNANLSNVNLTATNLTGANLTAVDLTGANLTNTILTGVLSGGITGTPQFLNIIGWQLINGYLIGPGANLSGANLNYAILNGANLSGANLSGANLVYTNLVGANLAGTNVTGANMVGAHFDNADLSNLNLTGMNLLSATMAGANLSGANLNSTELSSTDMSGAILTGAILTGAQVTSSNLAGANLSGANLSGIGIYGNNASLYNSNLTGANLTGADLTNIDLRNINISGADLTGAILTGVRSGGITGTPSALPANWQLINGYLVGPLTVTLDANGGTTPSPETISVIANATYGALASASRPCHTFNGWFTERIGGTEITSTSTVGITSNQTLYAQWTAATSNSTEPIVACGSYEWHGNTYTSSNNTATWTGQNAAGCDSIVTLNLTIKSAPTATITGNTTFCAGGNSVLTANATSGGGGSVMATAAGAGHSLFLKNDGTVWATGYNGSGQLGDGTYESKNTSVQVIGLSGITAMDAGWYHSLFLKNDGTVWATGRNNYGQLGDGTYVKKNTPVQLSGLSGITAIAAGSGHSLFLKNDGTVWATGYNVDGELGDGTYVNKNTPVQVSGLSGITAIAAGSGHSLFLTNDGTVWATGYNADGQLGVGSYVNKNIPVQVSGLSGITSIAAGVNHSLFLKNDGTVRATGRNFNGEFGDGTYVNQNIPVQVSGLSGTTAIAAGFYHSLFLKNDGTVRATGYNGEGQLGDGTYASQSIPVEVSGLSDFTSIAAGAYHSLFLMNDGTLWATGFNNFGQLGDGTYELKNTPVQVSGFDVTITSYQWKLNGSDIAGATNATYTATAEGNYTVVVTNSNGCSTSDSVTVVVNQPSYTTETIVACGSYEWHGTTYTSSTNNTGGIFGAGAGNLPTWTGTNAAGCDSIVSLDLTITPFTVNTTTIEACDSYTWPVNGQTYTTSGTHIVNAGETVFFNSLSGLTSAVSAAGYTLSATETFESYSSGPQGTLTGSFGQGSLSWTASATPGGSYTQPSGGSMTLSTFAFAPLTISFNPGVTSVGANFFVTNGGFATVSGTITLTLSDGSTQSFYTTTANSFGGFVSHGAFISSITIATSNDYVTVDNLVVSTGTINACISEELNLTINHPSTSTEPIVACGSYEWHGNTYTSSNNTATWTGTNAAGCDSIVTLNLTIQNPSNAPTSISSSVTFATAGVNFTLSVNGGSLGTGATWKWYTGSCGGTLIGTGASISVSQSANTTYFVRAEGTCNTTACSTITVNSQCGASGVTSSAGTTAICAGNPVTLTVVGSLSPGAQWRWDDECDNDDADHDCSYNSSSTFTVSPTSTKTYYVRSVGGACGLTACVPITVNVIAKPATPGTISGSASVCASTSVTYTIAAVVGATSYTWTAPSNATLVSAQGATSMTVSYASAFASGTLKVKASNCSGASSDRTLSVSKRAVPSTPGTISGASPVCAGSTQTYSISAVTNASNYTWTLPSGMSFAAGTTTNGTSVQVVMSNTFASGTISVKANNICGVSSSARTKLITGNALPTQPSAITGAATLCNGSKLNVYSVTAASGFTFNWTVPTGATITTGQGTNSIKVTWGTTTGTVSVTKSNSCGVSAPSTKLVTSVACRLDEEVSEEPTIEAAATSSNLLVYPNPTAGNANVVFGSEVGGKYTINVINALGQVVYSKTASSTTGENTHAIDINELSSGLYFINLLEESGMRSLRLVKR